MRSISGGGLPLEQATWVLLLLLMAGLGWLAWVAGGCTLREDSIEIGGGRTGRDDTEGLESWADADAEITN